MSNVAKLSKPFARPATVADCHELALTMREEDREELRISGDQTPLQALLLGHLTSKLCWAVEWKGKVVAIFGVAPQGGPIGIPWMLASDDLKAIRKSFLRECRDYVARMLEAYPVLTNHVWAENTVHVQWLKWLGFEFCEPQALAGGHIFYEFHKVRT